jgi:peptidoglycan/LPS O-acetylase OafA/YrhL
LTLIFLTLVWHNLDFAALACTVIGILILFFWKVSNPFISYLSKISYSLYLTHVLIGGKVINLGLRFVNQDDQRYILFFTALGISILCAHLFYLSVERPAFKFSKRFHYQSAYS